MAADGGDLVHGAAGVGEPRQGRLAQPVEDAVRWQFGSIAPRSELLAEVVGLVWGAATTLARISTARDAAKHQHRAGLAPRARTSWHRYTSAPRALLDSGRRLTNHPMASYQRPDWCVGELDRQYERTDGSGA